MIVAENIAVVVVPCNFVADVEFVVADSDFEAGNIFFIFFKVFYSRFSDLRGSNFFISLTVFCRIVHH